ncbi:hypothetical protein GGH92_010770, partial [Coemansia sp. RSA 2673]
MAAADRQDLPARLDHLLRPLPHVPASIAATPRLSPVAPASVASSKFSFAAAPTPKPLPATPRRRSQPAVFSFDGIGSNQQQLPQLHPAPSPVFPESSGASASRPALAPAAASRTQEMHFSQPSVVDVNAAQLAPPPQVPPPQAQPLAAQRRPSLLKRITSGWRKPPAAHARPPTLPPVAEEGGGHHHAGGAATAAVGADAAAGLFGRLFNPTATTANASRPM